MSILSDVKRAQLEARKAKNTTKASSLTTLIGEVETIAKRTGKELSDAEVSNLIKKTIEALHEVARLSTNELQVAAAKEEIDLLSPFMLVQLGEEQIRAIKAEIGATNVKELMAYLNANHKGSFDGKMAAAIANEK